MGKIFEYSGENILYAIAGYPSLFFSSLHFNTPFAKRKIVVLVPDLYC
jgi:hypothetical protein